VRCYVSDIRVTRALDIAANLHWVTRGIYLFLVTGFPRGFPGKMSYGEARCTEWIALCTSAWPNRLLTDWRHHPHIFKIFSARVRDVVLRLRGNVSQHLFVQRNIPMSLDTRRSVSAQDHQGFFVFTRGMPTYTLTRLKLYRATSHSAGLRRTLEQRAIPGRTVQRERGWLTL
jgi:hypothetical protein